MSRKAESLSIYDIARMSGVSISAVSKVLNGRAGIGDETKQRVMNIIKKHKYVPRVLPSNLDTIACCIPINLENNHLMNPYINNLLSGIGDIAFESGYILSIIPTSKLPRNEGELSRYFRQRKVSGSIFMLLNSDDDWIRNITDREKIILISQVFAADFVSVAADNRGGGFEAVRHLVEYGHRGIMLIMPGLKYSDHKERYEGAKQALAEACIDDYRDSIEDSLELVDSDLAMHLERSIRQDGITAIFAASDQEAYRVMRILNEKGIAIPEEVSIVGFDDYNFSSHTNPPLTTVRQPIEEIGKIACNTLLSMIEGGAERVNRLTLLETSLIRRKSVRLLK